MAAAVGLSKMHFAAQFRAATGFRPHEYLLFRRIERAKVIMTATNMPLVEVAFSVGFNAQAHFSTVFKRFTGKAPAQWKQECRRNLVRPSERPIVQRSAPCEYATGAALLNDRTAVPGLSPERYGGTSVPFPARLDTQFGCRNRNIRLLRCRTRAVTSAPAGYSRYLGGVAANDHDLRTSDAKGAGLWIGPRQCLSHGRCGAADIRKALSSVVLSRAALR